jgi:hypothetical protein
MSITIRLNLTQKNPVKNSLYNLDAIIDNNIKTIMA